MVNYMFEHLIKQLREISGRNDKMALLDKVKDNKDIVEAFRMCYDPFTVFYISKINITTSGNKNFKDSFRKFKTIAKHLCSRSITGDIAKDTVRIFLEELDVETQKIYINILNGDMKCGVNTSTVNKVFGDIIKKFEVQLAAKYDPEKTYHEVLWYATPKLDGIRGFFQDGILLARSGKPIIGFPEIVEELTNICEDNDLSFIDGELYSHDIPFQKIQGFVMRSKNIKPEEKKKIKFNIFAIGSKKGEWRNTEKMYDSLTYLDWEDYTYVTPLEYKKVPNIQENINALCTEYIKQGYEGAMLRSGQTAYKWKRTDDLLKVKLFLEEDFNVVGFNEGTGKHVGRLGAIRVEGNLDGKRIVCKVGSGYSDEERTDLWGKEEEYVGKKVEVKFQGITDREVDGNWSLRFPVFNKFKLDR